MNYLVDAYFEALNSPDPSTQNGAVLVRDREIIGSGCNRFPTGVHNTDERWNNRELKYPRVIHAETAAIIDAAKYGLETDGATLYCPWYACDRCAVVIIEAGIVEVVGHQDVLEFARYHNPRWDESISVALEMFTEAGVLATWVSGPLGGTSPILVGGQKFNPCAPVADQLG